MNSLSNDYYVNVDKNISDLLNSQNVFIFTHPRYTDQYKLSIFLKLSALLLPFVLITT